MPRPTGLKTMWTAAKRRPPRECVTKDEVVATVCETLTVKFGLSVEALAALALLAKAVAGLQAEQLTTLAPRLVPVRDLRGYARTLHRKQRIPRPRALGHAHRGTCGRLCFAGKSAWDKRG